MPPLALPSDALRVCEELAAAAAATMARTPGRSAAPTVKNHPLDWVTATDRDLEIATRTALEQQFPGVGVLGEEFSGPHDVLLPGEPGGPEQLWIVDPVDGTSNYVSGLPWFAFALGLAGRAGPVAGVVAAPALHETFSAALGLGLRRNGVAFVPAPVTALVGRLLVAEAHGSRPDIGVLAQRCRRRHVGLRTLGSSALAITQAAVGRAAAAVLPVDGYAPWDVAGPLALAHEAGLRITDHTGVRLPFPWRSTNGLVVAWPAVADSVLELVSP